MRICSVEGCSRRYLCRGFCTAHYLERRASGELLLIKRPNGTGGSSTQGYYQVTLNGRRVLEHVAVMERLLGRTLEKHELVHHINENKMDNRPENLALSTRVKHPSLHRKTFCTESHKECSHCHDIKPRSEFHLDRRPGGDPHQAWCKRCKNGK